MIADYFKDILDDYADEKSGDFISNEFARELSEKIPEELSRLIDNDNYSIKTFFGQYGWADYPAVTIIHKKFKSVQEALVIEYTFDAERKSILLSLTPRLKDFNDFISLREEMMDYLYEFNTDSFEIDDDSYSILSRKYSIIELEDSLINRNLDSLFEIYEGLLWLFSDYLDDFEEADFENHDLCDMNIEFNESAKSDEGMKFYNKGIVSPDLKPKIRITDIDITYPAEKRYPNNMNAKEELFTDESIEKIIRCDITPDDYNEILDHIKNKAGALFESIVKANDIDISGLKTKDKVLLFSKSFVKTEYKSVGRRLGFYAFDEIKIDDRLSSPLIITTIIHELSHHILEKILKEMLMRILGSNDTPLISGYVKIMMEDNDLNYLLDEFCAHCVEGRFALYGFQDYSSFKYKLDEISGKYSSDDIDYALVIANTFAYDIKDIMEDFIDEDMREDIKDEFLALSDNPDYSALDFEIETRLDANQLLDAVSILLVSGIGECLARADKLDMYMDNYNRMLIQ
jgi:hypothetical protein